MVAKALEPDPYTLFLPIFCVIHAAHRSVLKQLTRLGTYFNKLAKIANIWRASGNPPKIYKAWVDEYGEEDAQDVKRLIKKASGRNARPKRT